MTPRMESRYYVILKKVPSDLYLYSIYTFTNLNTLRFQCWENFLGETVYRLVIVDFLVTLLVIFFSEFIRR